MKIQTKILVMISTICIFSLLAVSLTTYFTVKNLTRHSREANKALSNDFFDGASNALLEQAYHFLQFVTVAQSHSCNNKLDTIKFDILLLEGVLKDIFRNPQNYENTRPVVKPSEIVSGTYGSVYTLPSNVSMTPELQYELGLLSNLSLLTTTLADNPEIIQFYAGMESGLFYNYTNMHFEGSEYDPRVRPWYIKAVNNPGDVIFTDVYEDAFGLGLVITTAKAVFDENEKLLGVVGLDILLTDLKELIDSTHITVSGYAFILNSEGSYIIHPDMGTDGFDLFLPKTKIESGEGLSEGYRRMTNGEEGFIEGELSDKNVFMTFSPISVAGWSIGIIVYKDELLSSLETLKAQMSILSAKSEENIMNMSKQAVFIFFIIFLIVIVMVVTLAVSLLRFISGPIRNLTEEVVKIGEGDFEYRIPVKTYDEIGFLTKAFNNMADNLYKYAQNIISLNDTKLKLEVAANTDTLTGIFNRRYFMESAVKENEMAVKTGNNAFVTILDLDNFKLVNDTYGHPVGDRVLKEIAEIVKKSIYSSDLFARYGGEEFILYTSNISITDVWDLIERIRQNIYKHSIELPNGKISVSASFGIAAASPENNLETAILYADESLYKAKNEGRNKTVFYGQSFESN